MSDFIDGFLSKDIDSVRQCVRARYIRQSDLLYRVNRSAVLVQNSIDIGFDSPHQQYSSCLFARTLTTTQASVLLLEHGLLSQAQMTLRCALETLFALGAIAKQPDDLSLLFNGYGAEKQRVVKAVSYWKSQELQKVADEFKEDGLLNADYGGAVTALSAWDLANKAGLEDWYRTVYLVLSWPVHGAVADVWKHAKTGPDGEVIYFQNEPTVESQDQAWLCCVEILLKAVGFLAVVFPNVDQAPFEKARSEKYAVFNGLIEPSE